MEEGEEEGVGGSSKEEEKGQDDTTEGREVIDMAWRSEDWNMFHFLKA